MDNIWPAHDAATGELVGYHVRKDRTDDTKDMYWEDASGNPGLDGFPTKDLALYPYPIEPTGEIVIVEGEKCVDVLREKGIPAVGTVCGAATCPGDDALRPLVEFGRIILWPDNDDVGRKHMTVIGNRLRVLGKTDMRIAQWLEAPSGGDCVDAIEAGFDIESIVSASVKFESQWAELESQDRPKVRLHTAVELDSENLEPPVFICEPWIVEGSITEISGKIKRAGKTTFITHMCSAVVKGESFLGKPVKSRPIVYLTEQPKASFKESLRRAGLLRQDNFRLLLWSQVNRMPWNEIASDVAKQAIDLGALLVVDTLPQFAAIRGDGENITGEALAAMEPLQIAASEGLGIVVVRHERKSGGEVGDSARGNSAFGGAVDTLVTIRRGEGNTDPTVRVLTSLSRFDGVPDELYVELTEQGYVLLGSSGAVAERNARKLLTDGAPLSEEDAMSIDDFVNNIDAVKRTTVNSIVPKLVAEGLLIRTGSGKKGSPFRYWKEEMLSFASKNDVTKESKFRAEQEEVQLSMLSFGTH